MQILFMIIEIYRKWLFTNIWELIFITTSIGTITLRKGLMEGGELNLVLKITVNQPIWSGGIKISYSLKLLSFLLSYMVVKYRGATFIDNIQGILRKYRSGL